jgi:hypothetical protein
MTFWNSYYRYGITIDLISTSQVHVSMVVGNRVEDSQLESAIHEIRKFGNVHSFISNLFRSKSIETWPFYL